MHPYCCYKYLSSYSSSFSYFNYYYYFISVFDQLASSSPIEKTKTPTTSSFETQSQPSPSSSSSSLPNRLSQLLINDIQINNSHNANKYNKQIAIAKSQSQSLINTFPLSSITSSSSSLQDTNLITSEPNNSTTTTRNSVDTTVPRRMMMNEDASGDGLAWDLNAITEQEFDQVAIYRVQDKSPAEIELAIKQSSLHHHLTRAEASLPRNLILKPSKEIHTDVSVCVYIHLNRI